MSTDPVNVVPISMREASSMMPVPQQPSVDPLLAIIERASRDPSVDIDKMQKLFEMHQTMQERRARMAFESAMASAKGLIPPIIKNKTVDFTSAKGRTNYRHEDLAEIARVVDPILAAHGLSYRHRSKQDGGKLTVTCIMSHADGYSDETTLTTSEDHTGNKNSIQAIGSTATYLQRYTLKLALGLSTTEDDDGKDAGSSKTTVVITEDQAMQLREMIEATESDLAIFCKYYGIEKLSDVPAEAFDKVMATLSRKVKR